MNKLRFKTQRGFSLVETVVYAALVVLIAAATVGVVFSLQDTLAIKRSERAVAQTTRTVLETMLREIRASDEVILSQTNAATSTGQLTLAQGTSTVQFALSSGAITYERDGVTLEAMQPTHVTITELFVFPYTDGEIELVRLRIGISAEVTPAFANGVFYGSAVLRGSYE